MCSCVTHGFSEACIAQPDRIRLGTIISLMDFILVGVEITTLYRYHNHDNRPGDSRLNNSRRPYGCGSVYGCRKISTTSSDTRRFDITQRDYASPKRTIEEMHQPCDDDHFLAAGFGLTDASSFEAIGSELDALMADDTVFPVLPPLPPMAAHGGLLDWTGQQLPVEAPARQNSKPKRDRPSRLVVEEDSDCTSAVELPLALATTSSEERKRQPKSKQSPAPSRWRKDQSKLGCLEQQAEVQQALADEVETENRRLRLRTAAMEHVLAAREKQLAILSQYHRLCGPGSSMEPSKEAAELHEAANASIASLVRDGLPVFSAPCHAPMACHQDVGHVVQGQFAITHGDW